MPTVIDSLIVTLGLDPTNFTRGQKQVVQGLQTLSQKVDQTNSTWNSGSKSMFSSAQAFQSYARAVLQGLHNINNQSRRTGLSVQAGARQGQTGLLAMASAGAAAYAAIKSIQGAYQQFTSTIEQTAGLDRLAKRVQVTTNWLSKLQIAAYTSDARVPYEDSASGVSALQTFFKRMPLGDVDTARLTGLGMLGVDITRAREEAKTEQDFLQNILEQTAEKLAAIRRLQGAAAAQAAGEKAGFSPAMSQFLSLGGANFRQSLDRAGRTAVTPEEAETARKMSNAVADLSTAWDSFIRGVQTSHPEWTELITKFSTWLKDIKDSPAAMKEMGDTFAFALVGTMLAAVGVFFKGITAVLAANPIGAALLGAWLANKAMTPTPEDQKGDITKYFEKRRGGGPAPTTTWGMFKETFGGAWDWLTGKKEQPSAVTGNLVPGVSGGTPLPSSAGSVSGGRLTDVPVVDGMTDKERDFLRLVLKYESIGGQNIMNYKGVAQGLSPTTPKGYTAQGYYQMLNTNWANLAPGLGIKAPNAMAGTPEEQTRVALALLRGPGGTGHWIGFNPKLATAWANYNQNGGGSVVASSRLSQKAEDEARIARGERTIFPPGTKFNSRGEAISSALGNMSPQERANVEASMAAIRAAQVSGKGWGTPGSGTTHNYGDVPIGNINVQTQATDAKGISYAIGGALRQNLLASQANLGLR